MVNAHLRGSGHGRISRQDQVEGLLNSVARVTIRVAVDTLDDNFTDFEALLCIHHLLAFVALAPGEVQVTAFVHDGKVPTHRR